MKTTDKKEKKNAPFTCNSGYRVGAWVITHAAFEGGGDVPVTEEFLTLSRVFRYIEAYELKKCKIKWDGKRRIYGKDSLK
ncbi:MAG: hypothetical protein KGI54_17410 [Pseudomonadota bacterium]|nr:hypothetical protein [Pseudomonadota bacterium]